MHCTHPAWLPHAGLGRRAPGRPRSLTLFATRLSFDSANEAITSRPLQAPGGLLLLPPTGGLKPTQNKRQKEGRKCHPVGTEEMAAPACVPTPSQIPAHCGFNLHPFSEGETEAQRSGPEPPVRLRFPGSCWVQRVRISGERWGQGRAGNLLPLALL
jgi:hypothetical protein